jgi:carboxymethylenebutenolidase
MPSEWTTFEVDGSPVQTYVSSPEGPPPFPPVIVAMHVFGVDRFVQGKCDELAEAGYVAVAPYLHHRQTKTISMEDLMAMPFEAPNRREIATSMIPALRDDELQRDMLAALEHARGLADVAGPAGVTGFCIGGRVAYLMAASTDEFGASAVFYGTDIAKPWGDGPTPLSMSADIRCPLAGFFGNQDQNPSPADVDAIDAELNRLGIAHAFNRYEGAPHAFNDPFNPVRWTPDAAADAWPKLLKFFDEALKAPAKP